MTFFLSPKLSPSAERALNSTPLPTVSLIPPKSPPERQRAASWAGWVRNVLPSQRPERGGTIRDKGYWESVETVGARRARRQRSSTHQTQSRRLKRMGSDQLIRWNTAKELSRKWSRSPDEKPRAAFLDITLDDVDRWSRTAHDRHKDRRLKEANAPHGMEQDVLRSGRLDSVATSVIDRRLSHAQKLLQSKEEAHRQRRSLKESGDYLGVQGFNPETGELDVITPTESEESNPASKTAAGCHNITWVDTTHANPLTPEQQQKEMKKAHLAMQQEKLRRFDTEKQQLKAIKSALKWRRKTKQWSSAHEPDLSTVAQSQASKSTSDHELHPPAHGNLIDIMPRPSPAQLNYPDGRVEDDRGSSGTVVRTPHRLSLAEVSPSALELFENGISFNHSSNSQARESDQVPGLPWMRRMSPDAISPTSQAADWTPPPGVTHNAGNPSPLSEKSFLDQGISINDPGGRVGSLEANQDTKSSNSWVKRLPRKKSVRHLLEKGSNLVLHARTNGDILSLPPDLTRIERDYRTESLANQSKQVYCQEYPSLANRLFSKKPRMPLRMLENLHSKVTSTMVKDALPEQRPRNISDKVHQDMMTLRRKLEIIDGPDTKAEENRTRLCDTDHEWIEETIRDITRKGMEALGDSACTPTITTTGYDPRDVSWGQKGKTGQEVDLRTEVKEKRVESACTRPVTQPSGSKKERFPGKTRQRALSNSTVTTQPTVTDTTSTSHLFTTRRRVGRLVTAEPALQSNPSQGAAQVREQAMDAKEGKADKPMEQMHRTSSGQKASIDACMDLTTKTAAAPRTQGKASRRQIPGSFPCPADDEDSDGTEGHSDNGSSTWIWSASFDGLAAQKQVRCAESDGLLAGVWWRTVFVLKLYWGVIGPVFDPHSVYWQRQGRQEATALDSMVLILALPAAILATAAVAWGMRMIAITGVYVRDAIGSFGGDVLYLYGG